jgi:predicted nucleic acid-binding protein
VPDVFYVDSSVAVHVLVGTAPAVRWFDDRVDAGDRLVSSRLLDVEVARFLRRTGHDLAVGDFLRDSFAFLGVDDALLREAAAVPSVLKTLDCLHLASASRIGAGLVTVVTHDDAMRRAADAMGFATHDPV